MLGLEGQIGGTLTCDLSPEALAAANINPTTRLATDYLNHFNNVVMLLDFIATMPDFVEEILQWQPMDYVTYFRSSHFRERELAVAAYEAAEPAVRREFERIIEALNEALKHTQDRLTSADPTDPHVIAELLDLLHGTMQPLIAEAGGIINGACILASRTVESPARRVQTSVDELFP